MQIIIDKINQFKTPTFQSRIIETIVMTEHQKIYIYINSLKKPEQSTKMSEIKKKKQLTFGWYSL